MATKKIICDTDVMIDYFDEEQIRHDQTKIILEQKIGLENIILSAVTKMELMAGAANKSELRLINKNINRFDLLLINPEITLIVPGLLEKYKLSHNLALADSIIAATSLHTNHELFTCNLKDFKFIDDMVLFKISE